MAVRDVLFLIFGSVELIYAAPLVKIYQGYKSSSKGRYEKIVVVVVEVKSEFVFIEHVFEERNCSVFYWTGSFDNHVLQSLAVFRDQHRVNVLQSFGCLSMGWKIFG